MTSARLPHYLKHASLRLKSTAHSVVVVGWHQPAVIMLIALLMIAVLAASSLLFAAYVL